MGRRPGWRIRLLRGGDGVPFHRQRFRRKRCDGVLRQVAAAQRGDIDHVLTLAGQFQPYQVVDVHPKVSGYMKKINVDIGDMVHKGETLAVLEVPELRAQLQQTVFEVQQSKDEITRAQHEIKRAEATHAALHAEYQRLLERLKGQPGLIAQQELDDAQAKDLSAESQVDAAKAADGRGQAARSAPPRPDNQRVQALQDYTNVVAPHGRRRGLALRRYRRADPGRHQLQQPGPAHRPALAERLLRLRMPVPEDDVQFVHVGDPMQVRVDAIGRSFTGKDRALHPRREFRNPNHGNRNRRGEQRPLDRSGHVRQHQMRLARMRTTW